LNFPQGGEELPFLGIKLRHVAISFGEKVLKSLTIKFKEQTLLKSNILKKSLESFET
jgi:hypothetical protein